MESDRERKNRKLDMGRERKKKSEEREGWKENWRWKGLKVERDEGWLRRREGRNGLIKL